MELYDLYSSKNVITHNSTTTFEDPQPMITVLFPSRLWQTVQSSCRWWQTSCV